MDLAAVLISVFALAFAVYSFLRQFGLQRRVTSIEEARRDEEVSARLAADVTATVKRDPREGAIRGTDTWLVLTNRGPAVAEEVDVNLLAEDEGGFPEIQKDANSFPLTLDAGQDYRLSLLVAYGMSPDFRVGLRWEDGRGPQRKTLMLSAR